MSLTVALSKGKLLAGSEALFRRAGLPFPDGEGRRLVVEAGSLRFLFVKDMDVPTYVEYGVADCGIAGKDVLLETGADVLEPLDLGFGRCRLVVASPRGSGFAPDRTATTRVASKYARTAAAHFQGRGLAVEVVRLAGSVEIAPGLGLADCIVDVVETGRTLAENGLEVNETVAESSARFVVNRASFHARRAEVQRLVATLRGASRQSPSPQGPSAPSPLAPSPSAPSPSAPSPPAPAPGPSALAPGPSSRGAASRPGDEGSAVVGERNPR